MGCRSETGASAKANVWRAPPQRSILKGAARVRVRAYDGRERTTVEIETEIEIEIEIDTYRNPVIHVGDFWYCSTI